VRNECAEEYKFCTASLVCHIYFAPAPFAAGKRIVSLRGGKQLAPTLIPEFMNIRFSSRKNKTGGIANPTYFVWFFQVLKKLFEQIESFSRY